MATFIQFITKKDMHFDKAWNIIGNGFSDTWNICKERGDIITLERNVPLEKQICPVTEGKVYVSAFLWDDLLVAWSWAKQNDALEVICGGPALRCRTGYIKFLEEMPANLKLTDNTMEEELGVEDWSGEWGLELPSDYDPIVMTYHLEEGCYWAKCRFCYRAIQTYYRKRPNLEIEFDKIPIENKMIWMNTPSVSVKYLDMIPSLPKDIEYIYYLRPDRPIVNKLKKILPLVPDLKLNFYIGIEFPSERLYNYMNKGYDREALLEALHYFYEWHNVKIRLSWIVGWHNIIEQDIDELHNFISRMPRTSRWSQQICRLEINNESALDYELRGKIEGIPQTMGPFDFGWYPKLSQDGIDLNTMASEIIYSNGLVNHGQFFTLKGEFS